MFQFIDRRHSFSPWLHTRGKILAASMAAVALISCSDSPSAPTGPMTFVDTRSVCHITGTAGSVIEILASNLSTHLSHGDYVARLEVDKQSAVIGDSIHFTRITDAIAAARATRTARNETSAASCRITIAVAPGVFQGSVQESADPDFERFPLVIDVPDITLRGAFTMAVDAGGRATGESSGASATTLVANPGLLRVRLGGAQNFRAEPLIVVTDAGGEAGGKGAIVEGFIFQSGNSAASAEPGGIAVFSMRVQDLVIRGNRIEEKFSEPITVRTGTAVVADNYLIGRGGSCAMCISGPGNFVVTGNRLMGPGGIPGILIFPVSILPVPPMVVQQVLPTASAVTVTVDNNEVRNHQQQPSGVGLRIGALGTLSSNVIGSARVVATNNTFVNNTFGVMIEAAFPILNTTLRSDVDLTLEDNKIVGNCQTGLYVSFARHSTGLGLVSAAQFQSEAFLRSSTYTVRLSGDTEWKDAWYANPAGLGNTLVVNGEVVPSGSRVAYDATRRCAS